MATTKFEAAINAYTDLISSGLDGANMHYQEYSCCMGMMLDKRCLVFGCGDDTPLWRATAREVIFIEDDKRWLAVDAQQIIYTTKVFESMEPPHLPLAFPEDLISRPWDVVLIDGPRGVLGFPGREQPTYIAALIREKCHATIILHDYNRAWEQACAHKYLGKPSGGLRKLAWWR